MASKKRQAAESLTLEQARGRLDPSRAWTAEVLLRLKPLLPAGSLQILEVGAAQGRALLALAAQGHEAFGLEPYAPAIEVAKRLAAEESTKIEIRQGRAECIPFESGRFDLVLAFSVMEHVDDLEMTLREIFRVLKPGGVFWFNSASSLCPIQEEIDGFPFFSWYPDQIKRWVMRWAMDHRPELIGFTDHPAIHWWTPRKAARLLAQAGFVRVWNRWQLGKPSEQRSYRRAAINLIGTVPLLALVADILLTGCSYAAQKPATNPIFG